MNVFLYLGNSSQSVDLVKQLTILVFCNDVIGINTIGLRSQKWVSIIPFSSFLFYYSFFQFLSQQWPWQWSEVNILLSVSVRSFNVRIVTFETNNLFLFRSRDGVFL